MREFDTFFHGIRNHLKIEHLNVNAAKKKQLIDQWDKEGWPDILVVSYDTFRLLNDKNCKKKIGRRKVS